MEEFFLFLGVCGIVGIIFLFFLTCGEKPYTTNERRTLISEVVEEYNNRNNKGYSDLLSIQERKKQGGKARIATEVHLRPMIHNLNPDRDFTEFIKKRLIETTFRQGDKIMVKILGYEIPFIVEKTSPAGIVKLGSKTQLVISSQSKESIDKINTMEKWVESRIRAKQIYDSIEKEIENDYPLDASNKENWLIEETCYSGKPHLYNYVRVKPNTLLKLHKLNLDDSSEQVKILLEYGLEKFIKLHSSDVR